MRDELEYVDDPVDPEEEPYRSSGSGSKKLYERSVMRLFVDGRRVAVPSGFGGDVKIPKGARPWYRVQVDADNEEGCAICFMGWKRSSVRKRASPSSTRWTARRHATGSCAYRGEAVGTARSTANWWRGSRSCSTGTAGGFWGLKTPATATDNPPVDANEATDILARYGLDDALSPEDDAGLWAAALGRHWPDPGDPDAPLDGMIFTVGAAPDGGADPEHVRHGLVEAERGASRGMATTAYAP